MISIPFRSALAVLANDDAEPNTGAAVPIFASFVQAKSAVTIPVTNYNAPLNDDRFYLALSDNFTMHRTSARRRRRRGKLFRLYSVQEYTCGKSTNDTRRNTAENCSVLAIFRMGERCCGERENERPSPDSGRGSGRELHRHERSPGKILKEALHSCQNLNMHGRLFHHVHMDAIEIRGVGPLSADGP